MAVFRTKEYEVVGLVVMAVVQGGVAGEELRK